jgi:hypothetical protein
MADEYISHGTPAALREFIAEAASMAQVQAHRIQTFSDIGDDAGLEYAVRRLIAYTRAAAGTLCDLKAMKQADGAR